MVEAVGTKFEPVERVAVPFKEGKHHLQVYNVNSLVDGLLKEIKEENALVTDELFARYEDADSVVEEYADWIEQHFDRRIQLFFMQLICTWNTPYHYEWIDANDQYGQGSSTYELEKEDGEKVGFPTQAAHSSTLPCLVAYPRAEWNKFQRKKGPKPEGFVYLKHGHSYLQHNGTVELARFVNQADIVLDGNHTNSRLRNAALKIVNAVAKGKYNPQKGMKRFLGLLDEFIRKGIDQVEWHDDRCRGLEFYLERLEQVKDEIEGDEGYFDTLLGVRVGEHARERVLRDVVYRKRFRLIQNCEAIESKIARDILNAQNKMLKKNNKCLRNVDSRLRYVLLEDVNPIFRKRLERLFCTSLQQLRTGVEQNAERLRAFEGKARIRTFREKHKGEIATLKRKLRARFRQLDSEELNYRAELFKGLRWDLNHWYGREFVAEFKKKFRWESMSVPMVSRMEQRTRAAYETRDYLTPIEQRRKDISVEKGKKVAETFGVDPGLFLPAIVSSIY